MSIAVFKQLLLGFKSPIYSVKFFKHNKAMLFLGVAPHLVNVVIYFWIVRNIILAKWLIPLFHSLAEKWQGSFFSPLFNTTFIEIFVWILGILLYGVFGTSFVNAVASPIYDLIAQNAYEKFARKKVPKQTFMDFIDSIISEITKAVIIFSLFIVSFFVQFFAPVVFFFAIWYLGWNNIDRTLLLLNLPLKKRILFGIKHWGLCVGLGIWCYIPIFGTLMAFSFAASGAIIYAHFEKDN
ncbi:EI24 domain-containing protein [Pigmentibacter ruber]|uniref:EI24 domain-containing protein n=1 Tax=Pigmentibacter ruber TaxID=2683196 RepID=UPI00131D683D|nr:EI24 domain-containing protein [Pigmentibacter ruber]BFD30458.1 hypothetical protein GTC16762_00760 [Pigmentibacter ruber]